MRIAAVVLAVALCVLAPSAAAAQGRAPALDEFIAHAARLWGAGETDALVEMAPRDGRIILDVGSEGAGAVQERHVAAALRSLFRERETVSVRPTRVTIAGGEPLSGFGELTWVSRSRGVTVTRVSIVYLGAVLDEGVWRLRELRVLK